MGGGGRPRELREYLKPDAKRAAHNAKAREKYGLHRNTPTSEFASSAHACSRALAFRDAARAPLWMREGDDNLPGHRTSSPALTDSPHLSGTYSFATLLIPRKKADTAAMTSGRTGGQLQCYFRSQPSEVPQQPRPGTYCRRKRRTVAETSPLRSDGARPKKDIRECQQEALAALYMMFGNRCDWYVCVK